MDIEALKRQIEDIDERIAKHEREKPALDQRLTRAWARLGSLDNQMEELRKRRQIALVDGNDCEEISAKLDGLKRDRELLDDEVAGLKNKLAGFSESEMNGLRLKKRELDRLILKGTLILPLVERYNSLAHEMAETLTQLDEALLELAKIWLSGTQDSGTRDFSGQQMPLTISLLGVTGDPLPVLIFDREALILKRKATHQ